MVGPGRPFVLKAGLELSLSVHTLLIITAHTAIVSESEQYIIYSSTSGSFVCVHILLYVRIVIETIT